MSQPNLPERHSKQIHPSNAQVQSATAHHTSSAGPHPTPGHPQLPAKLFFSNPLEDQRTAVNDRRRASREFFHCLCIWTTSPSRSGSIRHREVRDWGSGLCISTRLWCLSGPINLVSRSAVLACTLIDYHQACFAISSIAESSHARAFTRVQSNDLRCLMVTADWLPQEGLAPPGVTGVVVWIVLRVAENYLSI